MPGGNCRNAETVGEELVLTTIESTIAPAVTQMDGPWRSWKNSAATGNTVADRGTLDKLDERGPVFGARGIVAQQLACPFEKRRE